MAETIEASVSNPEDSVAQTVKRGRMIFFMIFIMGSLFSFWGLNFFVLNEPAQNVHIGTYVMFSIMAMLSFLYGFRFVKNYSKVRLTELKKHDIAKRKEAMVVATAIQLLLIEFVCIIGIFLAIFVQKQAIIYPFYFLFLVGLYFSYPKPEWYREVLGRGEPHQ